MATRPPSARTATASRIAAGSGATRKLGYRRTPGRAGPVDAAVAVNTSSGQLTSVGPGRPLVASANARPVSSATRSGRSSRTAHLVTGRKSAR